MHLFPQYKPIEEQIVAYRFVSSDTTDDDDDVVQRSLGLKTCWSDEQYL